MYAITKLLRGSPLEPGSLVRSRTVMRSTVGGRALTMATGSNGRNRITSYNVCYTKLLRLEAKPYIEKFGADKWFGLEYGQVRARYQEIPTNKTWIILCNAGTRSYEIQVFLDHLGNFESMVLGGGLNVISRLEVDWLIS